MHGIRTEGPGTDAERPGVDKEDKSIHRALRYAQRSPKQSLIIQSRESAPEELQEEGFWYRMYLMGVEPPQGRGVCCLRASPLSGCSQGSPEDTPGEVGCG